MSYLETVAGRGFDGVFIDTPLGSHPSVSWANGEVMWMLDIGREMGWYTLRVCEMEGSHGFLAARTWKKVDAYDP